MTVFATRWAALSLISIAMLSLGACAEIQLAAFSAKEIAAHTDEPVNRGEFKVGDPYEVNGAWYYPAVDPGYDEVGVASWYGEKFHGRPTANGAIYDMNALTAAHKTLPMPSTVRVTNLDNGRSMLLTVNDRGPFVAGRIIDVSRRAAQLLGFRRKGTVKVRVQIVRDDAPEPLMAAPAGAVSQEPLVQTASLSPTTATGYGGGVLNTYVQVGAFGSLDNATRLSIQLAPIGPAQTTKATIAGQTVYRVRLGPVGSLQEANSLLQRVIAAGHYSARLVVD